ncbi:DUF6531 domain-containing protein [Xylanimonas sp. McL0601]|uniref:DUF6531 domain-containing protein n=1 Tax=Xylanimonas sp. McL0601 TaxID=3414739 RepID=UPI003CF6D058
MVPANASSSVASGAGGAGAVEEPPGDLTAPDSLSAAINARLSGRAVEDLSQRTEFGSVFALPDGQWTSQQALGPVWVRRGGDGTRTEDWEQIDLTLVMGGDGVVRPVAATTGLELAGTTAPDAPAGDRSATSIAVVDPGSSDAAAGLLWDRDLPAPELAGRRATYTEVSPGLDLVVEATATGFEQFFVAHDAVAARAAVADPLIIVTEGATAAETRDGGLSIRDAKGTEIASSDTPLAWDATVEAHRPDSLLEAPALITEDTPRMAPLPDVDVLQGDTPNHNAKAEPAGPEPQGAQAGLDPLEADPLSLATTLGEAVTVTTPTTAQVVLDGVAHLVDDPDTTFPVVIDPKVNLNYGLDLYVQNDISSDTSGQTYMQMGTYNGGTSIARPFINFPTTQIAGKKVTLATMEVWAFHSYSCTARQWDVYHTGGISTASRWSNQPAVIGSKLASITDAKGYSSSCAAGWSNATLTSAFDAAAAASDPQITIGLRATSETDSYGWKKFYSANNGSYVPSVWVTYNSYPNTPGSGGNISYHTWYPDTSGTLYVKNVRPKLFQPVTDPDGGDVRATWTVHSGTTTAGTAFWSNMNGTMVASGGTSTATPSTSWAPLVDGATYTAEVWANDGTLLSTASRKLWTFIVDLTPPATPTVTASAYTSGEWKPTAPTSNTFTLKSTSSDVVKFQYKKDSDAAWTVLNPGTTSTTLSWAPTGGAHKLQVQAVDKAGWPSVTQTFSFGAGGATLSGPADGRKSTDQFTTTASGPPDAAGPVTATAYWRVSDGTAAPGDGTANGSTTGWTAIDNSTQTFAAGSTALSYKKAWSAASVVDAMKAKPELHPAVDYSRVPVRLAVQVCFTYSTGITRCTWNSSKESVKPTVTRVPHAFGDDFPTAEAGPGQVALWTGDFQTSDTDVSVPAYAGSLSVSRTYSSLAAPETDPVFGPGWSASFDGDDLGVAGWSVDDESGWDGTLVLFDDAGDTLTFRQPGAGHVLRKKGTYTAADQDTKDAGGVLIIAASQTSMTYTDAAGVKTVFAWSDTNNDKTADTWLATEVTQPASASSTMYMHDSKTGRVTQILGAVPAKADGTPAVSCTTLVKGCRALTVNYANTTTATSSAEGAYAGRVASIDYIAWDPDKDTGTKDANGLPVLGAMATVPVATYLYDAAGYLKQVTDPRSGIARRYSYSGTSTSGQPLLTGYQPTLGQASYTLAYGAVTGSDGATLDAHGLQAVSRPDPAGGTAQLARVVYGINPAALVSGLPDMRVATLADGAVDPAVGVGRWGQDDVPVYGAAVFGPDHPVATSLPGSVGVGDWALAELQYTDANGRVINTASSSEGDWQFTRTVYDDEVRGSATAPTNHVIKSLDARGIGGILAAGGASALAQVALDSYATLTAYNDSDILSTAVADGPNGAGTVPVGTVIVPSGTRVTDIWAPFTDVGEDRVKVRVHTHTDYDESSPNQKVNPTSGLAWGLPTTVTRTQVDALDGTTADGGETVLSRRLSGYDPIDDASTMGETSGWVIGAATVSTTVTDFGTDAGVRIRSQFDSEGRTIKTVGPKSTGTDAGTLITTYYTADGSASTEGCRNHVEWAGLVCQTAPAESGTNVPTRVTTKYSLWLSAAETQDVAGATTRTTATTIDAAGRPILSQTTVEGLTGSSAVDDTFTHYNGDGLVDYALSHNPDTNAETGRITSLFDAWGRATEYRDANNEITNTVYVPSGEAGAGSVKRVTDSKSAVEYTYNASGNVISQAIVTGAKTYTYAATWNGLGDLVTQTLPAGVFQENTYSSDGQMLTLSYQGTVAGSAHVPLLAWSLTADAEGRTTHVSTNAGTEGAAIGRSLSYGYDNAGRLVTVADVRNDVCQTRAYTFDDDGNRTKLSTGTYGGDCATGQTLQVTKDWSSAYDAADRLTKGASVTTTAWTRDETDGTTVQTGPTTTTGGAYGFDAMGRATALPAIDTPANAAAVGSGGSPTAGNATVGYYDTDAAASITQDGVKTTFTLDPAGRRSASTTTNVTTSTTITRRYGDGSDNPSWAQSVTGTNPASVSVYGSSIGGDLGFTVTDGAASLDLADPHGDTVTTVAVPLTGNATGIGAVACYDEYGNQATDLAAGAGVDGTATRPEAGATTGPETGALAYGWLGVKQRATDVSGLVLMGARLYNAVTGQFTSRDPVPGGNTTAYTYPQDPVNGYDLQGLAYGYHYQYGLSCTGVKALLFGSVSKNLSASALMAKVKANLGWLFPVYAWGCRISLGRTCQLVPGSSSGAVKVVGSTSTSWTFKSLPGHAEGSGHLITFSIKGSRGSLLSRRVRPRWQLRMELQGRRGSL